MNICVNWWINICIKLNNQLSDNGIHIMIHVIVSKWSVLIFSFFWVILFALSILWNIICVRLNPVSGVLISAVQTSQSGVLVINYMLSMFVASWAFVNKWTGIVPNEINPWRLQILAFLKNSYTFWQKNIKPYTL